MTALTSRALPMLASLALVLGVVTLASPAQAAVGVDLQVTDTTINLGESVGLSWTSTDAVTLAASGGWTGSKAVPSGTETATPSAEGTFTYTLTATDANAAQGTDTVEVRVGPGVSAPISPNPVTFPDACTVVVPTTANVTYTVEVGDEGSEEIEAGTYDGSEFYNDDEPVTFRAVANPGFTLTGTTEWDYTAALECLQSGPTLVTTDVACGEITFTNVVDETVDVLYGSPDSDKEDAKISLAPGASHTVKTKRDLVLYVAVPDSETDIQIDFVELPQGCGDPEDGSGHPTKAPAAGR